MTTRTCEGRGARTGIIRDSRLFRERSDRLGVMDFDRFGVRRVFGESKYGRSIDLMDEIGGGEEFGNDFD